MIVLDTHVLVWWLSHPASLSAKAKKIIATEAARNGIVASSISVLEIATLARRGRLQFSIPAHEWLADAKQLPELRFEPITPDIAELAGSFDDDMHGDPADRIIAATAIVLKVPLVTADAKLQGYKALNTVW